MTADLASAGALASQSDDPIVPIVFGIGVLILLAIQIGPFWKVPR